MNARGRAEIPGEHVGRAILGSVCVLLAASLGVFALTAAVRAFGLSLPLHLQVARSVDLAAYAVCGLLHLPLAYSVLGMWQPARRWARRLLPMQIAALCAAWFLGSLATGELDPSMRLVVLGAIVCAFALLVLLLQAGEGSARLLGLVHGGSTTAVPADLWGGLLLLLVGVTGTGLLAPVVTHALERFRAEPEELQKLHLAFSALGFVGHVLLAAGGAALMRRREWGSELTTWVGGFGLAGAVAWGVLVSQRETGFSLYSLGIWETVLWASAAFWFPLLIVKVRPRLG